MRLVREKYTPLIGTRGLSLFKPPYGRLTAIDLHAGDIVWQVANGPGPPITRPSGTSTCPGWGKAVGRRCC